MVKVICKLTENRISVYKAGHLKEMLFTNCFQMNQTLHLDYDSRLKMHIACKGKTTGKQ